MINLRVNISDYIPPCWYEFWDDVHKHKYDIYRSPGGRGSLKTTIACMATLDLIMRYPFACAVVFQKEQNLLRDGSYANYSKVIHRLGLSNYFKFCYSPLKIIYKPTGQYILFRGFDDPTKTKTIATDRDDTYFAIQHFEELDRFHGENDISMATQSVQRGGELFWTFQTYNPPQNRHNWVNTSTEHPSEGMKVYHTDYRMIPPAWLGKTFYNEMRRVRQRSELDYQWMYLGIATGNGGAVFKNIKEVKITPDMISEFDNVYNGLDWGWNPDPHCFVRWHYDINTDYLYALDEFHGIETPTADVGRKILSLGYNDTYTVADGAIGETVPTLLGVGVRAQKMYKGHSGNKSREFGIQWLASRKGICIDKNLTPFIYDEFMGYEYKRGPHDPDKFLNLPIDYNDHSVDASRYALSLHYQLYGDDNFCE